jgi:ethanolamine permease
LGSYVHFLYPAIPVLGTALSCYVIFTFIHFLGIKESAMFSLLVTILAVGELLLYMGLVAPSFEWQTFKSNPMPFGWSGVIAALPYAIWFYLAIEGVAMVAEEVDNPRKNIPKGYIYGIVTLVFLALGVMIFTGGAAHWEQLSTIDYPLPETLAIVLGKDNQWTKVFAGIGLFGLVASFHSTILGYSRQIFALSRAGYLPNFLSHVSPKLRTPDAALLAGGIIGIISILTGTTDKVIVLSVIGALVMYIISMVSLFVLRKKAPEMERPYSTPLYPLFPLTALILSVFSLIAIIYYNFTLSVYFTIGLVLTSFIYWMYRKNVATTL